MNHNITATFFNKPTHFSVSMPMFFQQMSKDTREDLIDHFKSYDGRWNPITKMWDFPPSSKVPVHKLMTVFGVRTTMPPMAEVVAAEKTRQIVAPVPVVVAEPRKVMVQVPVNLIGPENPAVIRMMEHTYARLEQEFYKLHMETGVCKTRMREILSRAVPAVPSPIFATR